MVNKQAHNIKQPRHPADYKNDVYGEYIVVHGYCMSLRAQRGKLIE